MAGAENDPVRVSNSDLEDTFGGTIDMKLYCEHGTLTLGTVVGLQLLDGSTGFKDTTVHFKASLANANRAMEGLVYQGLEHYNGADYLAVEAKDQGHTGTGGEGTEATAPNTIWFQSTAKLQAFKGATSHANGL